MKELKNRIRGVGSTKKITKAMQLVATAHLHRAREHSIRAQWYIEEVTNTITCLKRADLDCMPAILVGREVQARYLIVVCSTDRGMCGPFNAYTMKFAKKEIDQLLWAGKEVAIYVIGKHGQKQMRSLYPELIISPIVEVVERAMGLVEMAEKIADEVIDLFIQDKYDVCRVIYQFPQSTLVQVPKAQQLIPCWEKSDEVGIDYEYDSVPSKILEDLSIRYVRAQIYKIMLQSAVAEHAARMAAMDNATRNSDQLLKKLNLIYNRTRQQQITEELLDIISGAEAI